MTNKDAVKQRLLIARLNELNEELSNLKSKVTEAYNNRKANNNMYTEQAHQTAMHNELIWCEKNIRYLRTLQALSTARSKE